MKCYFYPAKLLSYDQQKRTAQVAIQGLTDGEPNGLTALLAYPIGDDDLDTERLLLKGADVWVFFENGDVASPVVAFYRSHGVGALVDVRRIRQENIELLAKNQLKIYAENAIEANTRTLTIHADVVIHGNITHHGDTDQSGSMRATGVIRSDSDVLANATSLKGHTHGAVQSGFSTTSPPI